MRILIVGAGAVGGYFGGILAKSGEDVTFLARGEHLRAIQKNGLSIKSITGNFNIKVNAVEKLTDTYKYDLIIFSVKSYDLLNACNKVKTAIKDDTIIMSLLNGVDSEDVIGNFFGAEKIIGSVAFIGSQIEEAGVILHTASGMITIGELYADVISSLSGSNAADGGRCEKIYKAFEKAKIPVKLSDNIQRDIWAKMVWNAGFNAVTALTGLTVSDILSVPETRIIVEKAMQETVNIANANGIKLPDGIVEKTISKSLKTGDIKTSMLQDREKGKRMEIDSINGAIVGMGKKMNISVPVNETLYGVLKVINDGAVSEWAE